jgi:hypothetical protein
MLRAVATATQIARAWLPLIARRPAQWRHLLQDDTSESSSDARQERLSRPLPETRLPETVTDEGWHHYPYEAHLNV